MARFTTTVAALAAAFASAASAITINVPADQPTISAAFGVAVDNDVIQLSAGPHTITNTIVWRQNGLTLQGAGSAATTVTTDGWGTAAWAFDIDGVTGAAVRGLTLTGQGANKPDRGLKIFDTDGVEITDVSTSAFRRSGVDVNGASNIVIDGGEHTGHGGHGFSLKDNTNLVVRNSVLTGNNWSGISISNEGRYEDSPTSSNVVESSVSLCGNSIPFQLELNKGTSNLMVAPTGEMIPMSFRHPRTVGVDVIRGDGQDFNVAGTPDVDIQVTEFAWLAFGEPALGEADGIKLAMFFCCDAYPTVFDAFAAGLSGHIDSAERAWRDIRPEGPGGLIVGDPEALSATYAADNVPAGEAVHPTPGPIDGSLVPSTVYSQCGCEDNVVAETEGLSTTISFYGEAGSPCGSEEPPVVPMVCTV